MKISLIVAADLNNGIGYCNQLLCHLPADLKYFKNLTTGHHILMGKNTYNSIGKPLPNRTNLVVSKTINNLHGCHVFNAIDDAIAFALSNNETELFIIGGDSIYKQCMYMAETIYITRIKHTFTADTFFPVIDPTVWQLQSINCHEADNKNAYNYCFEIYHQTKKQIP